MSVRLGVGRLTVVAGCSYPHSRRSRMAPTGCQCWRGCYMIPPKVDRFGPIVLTISEQESRNGSERRRSNAQTDGDGDHAAGGPVGRMVSRPLISLRSRRDCGGSGNPAAGSIRRDRSASSTYPGFASLLTVIPRGTVSGPPRPGLQRAALGGSGASPGSDPVRRLRGAGLASAPSRATMMHGLLKTKAAPHLATEVRSTGHSAGCTVSDQPLSGPLLAHGGWIAGLRVRHLNEAIPSPRLRSGFRTARQLSSPAR